MDHRFCNAEFKLSDDAGSGGFAGYASTWDLDRQQDIVTAGAFKGAIEGFLRDGFIGLGHDWSGEPIAYPVEAKETDKGLWLRADFHGTARAQSARQVVRERMAAGKTVGLSIGFSIREGGSAKRDDGVREIREVKLFEVSLVSVPANPMARVASIKNFSPDDRPLAGWSVEEHSASVLATVREYAERMRGIRALRLKEGRVLSAANRERMRRLMECCGTAKGAMDDVMTDLTELLEQTEPKPRKSLAAVRASLLRREAMRLGIGV